MFAKVRRGADSYSTLFNVVIIYDPPKKKEGTRSGTPANVAPHWTLLLLCQAWVGPHNTKQFTMGPRYQSCEDSRTCTMHSYHKNKAEFRTSRTDNEH
jgi:hypothetical protein